MKAEQGMSALREPRAREAALAPDARVVLMIQCARAHHVARVLHTSAGLVVESHPNRRSHGRRDLHSDSHGVDRTPSWCDLLDPADDPAPGDAMPAGCACGDRMLSRRAVADWIAQGESRVIVD